MAPLRPTDLSNPRDSPRRRRLYRRNISRIGTAYTPALAEQASPKDLVRIQCGSGHAKRDGRWVVPHRMEVRVTSGHVLLDFTRAVITAPEPKLDAEVRSGHLLLITRPGVAVDADEVAVRSGHLTVRAPWSDTEPVQLRVEITGSVRSGHLTARPPRRTFWQWLRRAPRRYELAA